MSHINRVFSRWKEILVITGLTKLLLLFLPIFSNIPTHNILYSWVRWDGPHYIDIAKNWYQPSGEQSLFIVFYPLYPFLIKFVSFLTNDFQISAILVAIFFSFTASIALFELTILDFNKKTALLAVWFLNIFPTAYFLQASYTESLFLTLSIATVYFFRKELYTFAGGVGALATLTRVNGLFLLPALFLEKLKDRSLIAFLLIPLGFLDYLLVNYIIFHDPFYFSKPLLSNWFKKYELPLVGIKNLINSIPSFTNPDFYIYFSELVATVFIVIMILIVYFKVKKSYALYMLLNLLLFTSTSYILSTPRYSLSLFPIFIALGMISNQKALVFISVVFIVLLVYFTYLYTQGRWAS